MPTPPPTEQTLRAENAGLRARLDAAEEMLRAIRAGEVDALVVEGDAGPRLFTPQRRDAGEVVRYREQFHRIAFDQAPTGMVFAGLDGRFIQVNARMCEITGYSAEEMVRMNISDLTHPEDRESDAPLVESLLSGGTPLYENEKRYVCKGGIIRWVAVSARMVNDGAGRPLHTVGVIHDITARKETEAALRLTNERLTLAVKCSQVVLFQQDLELRYTWHRNPELGLKFSDFTGKRDVDLMERAADAAVTEGLKREVIRTGVGQRQEVLVHIQGVDRHYDLLVEPQRDAAGCISGVICAAIDITARKETEAALQLTNERLTLAVKCSQVVLFQMDLELRYTWLLNSAPGWDDSQVVGKRNADLVDLAEDAAVFDALKREVIRNGVSQRAEIATQVKGALRHFDLTVEPLLDAAGLISGITGAAVDITERKRAETAQRETERDYRALADASLEVPYRMSADWSTMLPLDGRELFVSSDRPVADWEWMDHYLPRDEHARVRQAVSDAIARKKLFEMEHRVLRLDGSTGWVHSRSVPILDENEEVVEWFGATSDITARKQAEEERRLLASIVENSRDFIGISDTHGNPVYGNRAAMELVGVQDLGEVRRSKIIDYFIPEQRPFVEEVVLPAVFKDGRWAGELTLQHFVTGAKIPVWYDLFRVDDPVTGQPVNFATITRDLTASKRVEQALAERTELLNGVLEGTTDVIFVKDLNGRLLLANTAFAAAAISTPEQLVGKTDEDLFPPDVAAAVRQQDEAVIAGGSPVQFEETIPVAGEARSFLTLKAPLRDGSGRVVGILGISRDITERKRAEEALRAGEVRMRLATAATEVGIWEWNVLTGFIHWDAQMFRLYGVAPTADGFVSYDTWSRAVLPEDLARQEEVLQETLLRCGRSTREFHILRADDGECRWIQAVETVRANEEGKAEWVIGTNLDVTEQKNAERAIRESSEKAVAANAAKDRFLAALSHELRTPLTPVLLLSGVHSQSQAIPEALREDFAMIHRNVVLEAQLIDDLLDVSRIQQGKMRFAFKPTDVHEAIARSLEMVRAEAEEKAIAFGQELRATPATIEADPARLRQVMSNLLRNALKFTPRGGTVTVRTARQSEELQISVADNGAGIAATDLERIFQPFEQVDLQQKSEYRSLGLGLAISGAIIAAHRGRIWAESPGPGQGATFHVRLPF